MNKVYYEANPEYRILINSTHMASNIKLVDQL